MPGVDGVTVIERGEGCYVWDHRGKRYLDGLAGLFTVQAGHGRTELAQAASKQASELAYFPIWTYAHPTAIELTIAGLRSKAGAARILAVLEPRSATMKMGVMKDSLGPSLRGADLVFCYTNGVGWDARAALAPLGAQAGTYDDLAQLVAAVVSAARPGDHVLVMSNGGFGGVHAKLLQALSARG